MCQTFRRWKESQLSLHAPHIIHRRTDMTVTMETQRSDTSFLLDFQSHCQTQSQAPLPVSPTFPTSPGVWREAGVVGGQAHALDHHYGTDIQPHTSWYTNTLQHITHLPLSSRCLLSPLYRHPLLPTTSTSAPTIHSSVQPFRRL